MIRLWIWSLCGLSFVYVTSGLARLHHLAHAGSGHHEDQCTICVQISLVQKQTLGHLDPPPVQVMALIGVCDVPWASPVVSPLAAALCPRAPPC